MRLDGNPIKLAVVGMLAAGFTLSLIGGTGASSARATKRQLLVAGKDAGSVYRLEVKITKKAKAKFKKEIKGFDGPAGIAISSDEKFALVTNSGGNSVSRIEVKKGKITSTTAVGKTPTDVVLTPDDLYAFVANSTAGTLSVYDVKKDKVTATIKLPGNPLAIAMSPGGRRVFASTDANILAAVNVSDFVPGAARPATRPYAEEAAARAGIDVISYATTCLMSTGMSAVRFRASRTSLMWTCNRLFPPSSARSTGDVDEAEEDDDSDARSQARAYSFDNLQVSFYPSVPPGSYVTEISQGPPHLDKQGACTSGTVAYTHIRHADPTVFESLLWQEHSRTAPRSLGKGVQTFGAGFGGGGSTVYAHAPCGANCNLAKVIKKMAELDLASKGASNIVAAAMIPVPAGDPCPQ